MMFTSRARALSEMGLAVWALQNDPWSTEQATPEEIAVADVILGAFTRKPGMMPALEKWLKESAEGRGSFI